MPSGMGSMRNKLSGAKVSGGWRHFRQRQTAQRAAELERRRLDNQRARRRTEPRGDKLMALAESLGLGGIVRGLMGR